jgi:aldehyde dehydrogenase (NAD+)
MSQLTAQPHPSDPPPDPSADLFAEPLSELLPRLRAGFATGRSRSLDWRLGQLDALRRLLDEREDEFVAALGHDLGKPPFETWAAELRVVSREIHDIRRNLRRWVRPERQKVPLILRPGRASIVSEPLGLVLVIAPWNFPVQLLLAPLAAAIAAGNAVVCKPSEVSSATSATLARLLPQYLDPDLVAVVEGGVPETTALLEQRWDHILYTGNGTVGRIVAAAAAKHLTPVTLELGGKSPAIVDRDANVKLAASRIAFSKFLNSGQTCVASDHVYVHSEVADRFLAALRKEILSRYGKAPAESRHYGRVVTRAHTERIKGLLDAGGFDVAHGGEVDVDQRYVAPTVLTGVAADAEVMGEEIFGPVLPVLTFDDIAEPIAAINDGDKPLALYLFTSSDDTVRRVLDGTSSGGVCVNDAITHLLVPGLPFGGVGESGYGAYHGKAGFDTFSHRRSVLRRPSRGIDPPLLNPPYSRWKTVLTRKVF